MISRLADAEVLPRGLEGETAVDERTAADRARERDERHISLSLSPVRFISRWRSRGGKQERQWTTLSLSLSSALSAAGVVAPQEERRSTLRLSTLPKGRQATRSLGGVRARCRSRRLGGGKEEIHDVVQDGQISGATAAAGAAALGAERQDGQAGRKGPVLVINLGQLVTYDTVTGVEDETQRRKDRPRAKHPQEQKTQRRRRASL